MQSKRSFRRLAMALLMILCMALGPFGCGGEVAIGVLATTAVIAGLVAFTVIQFESVREAHLKNDKLEAEIEVIRNGQPATERLTLTQSQYDQIKKDGKIKLNGQEVKVD